MKLACLFFSGSIAVIVCGISENGCEVAAKVRNPRSSSPGRDRESKIVRARAGAIVMRLGEGEGVGEARARESNK